MLSQDGSESSVGDSGLTWERTGKGETISLGGDPELSDLGQPKFKSQESRQWELDSRGMFYVRQ